MTITSVNSNTFIADLVNYIRDRLNSNVADPLNRSLPERFVMTSYPRRKVRYPIITVTDTGSRQEGKLGMGSQGTILRLGVEIRIWARNVKERDEIFGKVYDYLRTNQLSGDFITGANLYDFSMDSVVNVSEPDVKSKVMEVTYLFLTDGIAKEPYGLPFTGQTISYMTGDDGYYKKGRTINKDNRFTDNGDGTITDNGTGLMWIKDPVTSPGAPFNTGMTWTDAVTNCESLNFAGHTDWRLPNIKELMSIVDYGNATTPSIDENYFACTTGFYWSSTTLAVDSDKAWNIHFDYGVVYHIAKTTNYLYVRPVRLGGY
ncbi:MAG: Lcl C-terminal domain-containing protein [Candidatus Heimdallarchaeaceae archaeon]